MSVVFSYANSDYKSKDHQILTIFGPHMQEADLLDERNYRVMQAYVIHMLPGVPLPLDLVSCREHRVALRIFRTFYFLWLILGSLVLKSRDLLLSLYMIL